MRVATLIGCHNVCATMHRSFFALGLAVLAAPTLPAAELSKAELSSAITYLQETSAAFVAATKGLSEDQLKFKPAADRWSIADVAEHIAATEDRLMGMIKDKVMQAPARTEPADVKEIDAFVLKMIPDRTNKVQAPEELKPLNRFGSTAATMTHFAKSRALTMAFLKETKGLRDHAVDSPLGKKLDAYQWILFVGAHCERHTKQIAEVKADPKFPKQ